MTADPYRTASAPTALTRYVSTGKTPLTGLLAGVAAGIGAALLLSVIYAYGTIYIPIVQIECLLTIAFGAAIGASTAGVMHRFKVRSRLVTVVASALLGALGWAFSWLPWLYGTYNSFGVDVSLLDVINPFFVLDAIGQVYETGTWSVGRHGSGGDAVSGPMLGLVWVVEALLVIGFATWLGVAMSAERVFCERCESWCTVHPECAAYRVSDGEMLRGAMLERADFGVLREAAAPEAPDHWLALKLGWCPSCGETNVVALDEVRRTVDRKGNVKRTPKPFLAFHHVTRDEMRAIREAMQWVSR